jgi:hypothetical protein
MAPDVAMPLIVKIKICILQPKIAQFSKQIEKWNLILAS